MYLCINSLSFLTKAQSSVICGKLSLSETLAMKYEGKTPSCCEHRPQFPTKQQPRQDTARVSGSRTAVDV